MSRIYTINGVEYPSVTTVLDTLSKGDFLLQWAADKACEYIEQNLGNGMPLTELLSQARSNFQAIKSEAGDIGSQVHHLIEQSILGRHVVIGKLRKEVQQGFMAFVDWKRKHKVNFKLSERVVSSKEFCYAGTLDTVFEYEGSLIVGDWKTSGGFYETFPLQISAYRHALLEQGYKTDGEMIIRLDKYTGAFEVKDYSKNHEKYLNAFLRLLDFYYAQKKRQLKGNPRVMECGLSLAA